MTITIKDEALDRAVRSLAEETGQSLVGAIRRAVANERARQRATAPDPGTVADLDDLVAAAKATRVPGARTELEWDAYGAPV